MNEEAEICKVCGEIVHTPLKCSECKAAFHPTCITKSSGKIRKKKSYVCPECGHSSDSYSAQIG